jgi:DNA-binding GntR family transcriptional regulator
MTTRMTFDRVYTHLKNKLLSGELPPGTRIDPALLKTDLAASITPVRDALYRLVGERLVISQPAFGFHVPYLTEPALKDLYDWREELLLHALNTASDRLTARREAIDLPDETAAAAATLFQMIATRADSSEIRHAVDSANDRLHALRRRETMEIADADDELARIKMAFIDWNLTPLRRELRRYHRRRRRLAGVIVDPRNLSS